MEWTKTKHFYVQIYPLIISLYFIDLPKTLLLWTNICLCKLSQQSFSTDESVSNLYNFGSIYFSSKSHNMLAKYSCAFNESFFIESIIHHASTWIL